MSNIIFRTINGVVRPINVSSSTKKVQVAKNTPNSDYKLKKNHYANFRAFTVPNVKCKTCHQLVYYYEHPSGSRVLFDELGPPWPLHPCFIAGQLKKQSGVKTPAKSVSKKEKGWFPLVIERAERDQDNVNVHARSENAAYVFTIPSATLRERMIEVVQVKRLLAQARQLSATDVQVQLHDGMSSWEQQGKVFIGPTVAEVPASGAMVLSEKKLKNLSLLQNFRMRIDQNKLHVDYWFRDKQYHQALRLKKWRHFRHKVERLRLYYRIDKQGANPIFYALDPASREYFSFAMAPVAEPASGMTPPVQESQVMLEDIWLEDVDSLQVKLRGKIDTSYITLCLPRACLRAGEGIDSLLQGDIALWLSHAGGAECHIAIGAASDPRNKTARGKITVLSCVNAEKVSLPAAADFNVIDIDIREDAHVILTLSSQGKIWHMPLFVSDYQRNWLITRFAMETQLLFKQRRNNTKNMTQLYVDNRCVGYYKKMLSEDKPTLTEVVLGRISEETALGLAFSEAIKKKSESENQA